MTNCRPLARFKGANQSLCFNGPTVQLGQVQLSFKEPRLYTLMTTQGIRRGSRRKARQNLPVQVRFQAIFPYANTLSIGRSSSAGRLKPISFLANSPQGYTMSTSDDQNTSEVYTPDPGL
ncbi:MAG: hypothetical protein AAF394_11440, partial [Planctomycetota bacterium]